MYPPVYRPPVPPPPPRRKSFGDWAVPIVLIVACLMILMTALVAVMALIPSPRIQDTQAYQTGQQIGADFAVPYARNGVSAYVACQDGLGGWQLNWQMVHPSESYPSWWNFNQSTVMQGCTDYVHQHEPLAN